MRGTAASLSVSATVTPPGKFENIEFAPWQFTELFLAGADRSCDQYSLCTPAGAVHTAEYPDTCAMPSQNHDDPAPSKIGRALHILCHQSAQHAVDPCRDTAA